VTSENNPPEARAALAAGAAAVVPSGSAVALDGTGSADPLDGDPIATWAWTVVELPPGGTYAFDPGPAAAAPSVTLAGKGTWRVALVVGDGSDASAPSFLALTGV
jgi:hypothetical protein